MLFQQKWAQLRSKAEPKLRDKFAIIHTVASPTFKKTLNTINKFIAPFRSDARWLAMWFALCVCIAIIYVMITPAEYNASTLVILEPRRPFSSSPIADAGLIQTNLDNSQVESQIQIVKSEQVLKFVFRELNLQADPEFVPQPSLMRRLWSSIFGSEPQNILTARHEAIGYPTFADHVYVRRIGQSLVLEISYRSRSPERAASIANSVTAAFIRDQIESKSLSMRRNGEWLQGRIDEIKAQEDASVEAVRKGISPSIQFSASDARIISSASVPFSKSFPQTGLLMMFAGAFALLTGFGFISIRHSFDRKIRSKDQLTKDFGLECLSVVPRVDACIMPDFLFYCVSEKVNLSPFSESIRSLRMKLINQETAKKPFTIGIVSCFQNEGKSIIASNLAFLLAKQNKKTVLIDADFRQSMLTKNLVKPIDDAKIKGVSSLFQEKIMPALITKIKLNTTLDFIPATDPKVLIDPNLFINPQITSTFLETLKDRDYVIFDLPALSLTADINAISPALDAVIIVIEAEQTSIDDVKELIQTLQNTNTKVLGAVLNKVNNENLPRLQQG